MDWCFKAALTAAAVVVVLLLVRAFSRRLAGIVAGLPIISAPAFVWIAFDQGGEFASKAAFGGVVASGVLAIFSLAYERLSRYIGPVFVLPMALLISAIAAMFSPETNESIFIALIKVTGLCFVVLGLLPNPSRSESASRPSHCSILIASVVAGVAAALVSSFAATLGAFWSGVVASLPIISAVIVAHQHAKAERVDVQRFLHGYTMGLLGKAFFAAAFSFAILHSTIGFALFVATVAGAAALLGAIRVFEALNTNMSGNSNR
jgi:hypothetical protein